jgi:homoserine O-acetyltransferase
MFDSTDEVRTASPLKHVQEVVFRSPLRLERGATLSEIKVAYETYGKLNERKDNAILICHALSGDSHVASHDDNDDPGWWDVLVGSGKPIDTDKYFVICPNCLGGCRGTTGPDDINPETGRRYGMDFPEITVADIVEVECLLIDYLGIGQLLAVVGGSLGGMMAMEWSVRFPDRVLAVTILATGTHLTSQALAFDIVARNAIQSDPNFHGGHYRDKGAVPADGLSIARMLGHITYLSRESMTKKFDADRNQGRDVKTKFETRFSVGSYLAHQGNKFVERFDANSYITISTAIDNYDLGNTPEELQKNLRGAMCRWLILSFSTDWLFPPDLSKELADALLALGKRVNYCDIPSGGGHDSFLLPENFDLYGGMIRGFLNNVWFEKTAGGVMPFSNPDRLDYEQILDLIPRGAKVLDLGCGKGGLLARLKQRETNNVVGIEIKAKYILQNIERGIDVVQSDLNTGLKPFGDKQFDFVVLSKTLQTVKDVEFVLDEMLRVGTRCIVSFLNLGFLDHRERLSKDGLAPRFNHDKGVEAWYEADGIRHLTLADFESFCRDKKYRIHHCIALNTREQKQVEDSPNLNADEIIVVLSK